MTRIAIAVKSLEFSQKSLNFKANVFFLFMDIYIYSTFNHAHAGGTITLPTEDFHPPKPKSLNLMVCAQNPVI